MIRMTPIEDLSAHFTLQKYRLFLPDPVLIRMPARETLIERTRCAALAPGVRRPCAAQFVKT